MAEVEEEMAEVEGGEEAAVDGEEELADDDALLAAELGEDVEEVVVEELADEEGEVAPEEPPEEVAPDELPEEVPEEEMADEDCANTSGGAPAGGEAEVADEEAAPEHLRDAVEGSFRLKRYLTQDEDDGASPASKVPRIATPEELKVKQLMMKWRCPTEIVVKYVLEQLSPVELDAIVKSNYMLQIPQPHADKYGTMQVKAPADVLAKYIYELRERKLISGGNLDAVSSFRGRWKLPIDADKPLRSLGHKDLRYVVAKYDGSAPLEEVMGDAANMDEDIDGEETAEKALPNGPGPVTLGRFSRLELIDPLADSAVFGDANLTFSLRLAKHRKSMGHVGRVIATTFEELDTLKERYAEIDENISALEDHYAEVYHGVDCTRIAIDSKFEGLEGALGAVYYNYPHSGAVKGFFDGHPIVNWRHENLMRLFFRSLRSFVKPGGIVKLASNMSAVGVRYSYIVGSAIENEFIHTETMPFLEWHMHRYGRSYGDKRDAFKRPDAKNNQSYNAQRAESDMVYCFRYAPTGDTLPPQTIRYPPTLKTLLACTDGPFKHLHGVNRENLAKQLHKRFVNEVSGVHVG